MQSTLQPSLSALIAHATRVALYILLFRGGPTQAVEGCTKGLGSGATLVLPVLPSGVLSPLSAPYLIVSCMPS
jgi:hypothetical protein